MKPNRDKKSYFWQALTSGLAGSLLGTYFPASDLSHRLHESVKDLLLRYPAWAHLPLIAFLFVLFFSPSVELFRRYRQNWRTSVRFFTVIDATTFVLMGCISAALLNGSLPHTPSGYSRSTATALVVWGAACGLFLLITFICSHTAPKAITEKTVADDQIDAPITEDAQDILGRLRFVQDFYAQIVEFPSEGSFVFGLNGAWGSGKTSVLNLLRNRLRKNESIFLVDFNPWYFQSAETITRRFYEGIAETINRKFFYPRLRSIVRRYAQILAPILKRYGIESIRTDDATVEEIKEMVESYIEHTERRVVVLIDDLDRAHENELLTVFQIVRLSGSFRRTIFVLAYDQAQLLVQLKKAGVYKEYLEKIVQQPVDLPAANKNEIDRFVIYSDFEGHKSQIDKLLDKLAIAPERRKVFDKKSVEMYASTLGPFFATLRGAKRFLTGFSVRLPVVVNEVNLNDFFLLEILRVFANHVFQDIWNNQHYYIPGWTTRSLMSSPFGLEFSEREKDARREEIRKHVDQLLENDRHKDNLLKILKELFPPRILDAFGRHANYGDDAAARFRAEKRLTHPDSFEKYFLLSVPKGVVPDSEVERKLASWRDARDHEKQILEDLRKLRQSHELVEVLNRIVIFLGSIDASVVKPLLGALSRHVESIALDGDSSEQSTQLKLIIFLLSERVVDAEKQAVAESIITDIRFIDVAVRFIHWMSDNQVAVTWGLQRVVKIVRMQELVVERFSREFVDTGTDIFVANNNPLYVLFQVGSYESESRKTVNIYVSQLLEKEPKYIGKLIDAFLIEFPGSHGPNGFQMDLLRSVYDTSRLAELAIQAGENAWSNEKQKRAIDLFLHALVVEKSRDVSQETSLGPDKN
jgi:predicted KAP-like P-loop ATPase